MAWAWHDKQVLANINPPCLFMSLINMLAAAGQVHTPYIHQAQRTGRRRDRGCMDAKPEWARDTAKTSSLTFCPCLVLACCLCFLGISAFPSARFPPCLFSPPAAASWGWCCQLFAAENASSPAGI